MRLIRILAIVSAISYAFNAAALDKNATQLHTYITGGIVGTFAGFGIGHGINGNYTNTGWIFTLTEGVGAAAFLTGALINKQARGIGIFTPGRLIGIPWVEGSEAGDILMWTGGVIAGAFRIWETIDLWTTPLASSKAVAVNSDTLPTEKSASLTPFVDSEVGGLALNF